MRETVEQAYKRGQEDMRTVLALCLEIVLGKDTAEKARALSTMPYSAPPDSKEPK